MSTIRTISPVDGRLYAERTAATAAEIDAALGRARAAQRQWHASTLAARAALLERFCAEFESRGAAIAQGLAWQMGRPIRFAPSEVRGTLERARYMIGAAAGALADLDAGPKPGFRRFIRREPLGVVFTVAAWNYPYLIAVNSVVPALMAGNAVILKHSAQTPLAAEAFAECLAAAGLPPGVFQVLHLSHEDTERVIGDARIDFVAFTGSVAGGRAVQRAAAERFVGVGLELGGCDPVYVRDDADLQHAVENIVDGAYFNSGQSCCGLQRIFVHESLYEPFTRGAVELIRQYRLGDPLDPETTLGPLVRTAAADAVRAQIRAAVAAGARPALEECEFPASRAGTPYLAPQLLLDAPVSSTVMREEIFGPVAGVMQVASDAEAVARMNDSAFGLTAAVWTRDAAAAERLGAQVETGTFFMNRCDYLDPALAWVGVKDSGRGCTLSVVGYEHLTRPKSFHLRVMT
ncbi:MAG TPA: aldehyde dehydrogenase family protein [Steroidobacteraceae bacterium]|nr:aldehyde dehydrogenase family protein [Gammaproteobacteria bacterium]HEV2286357.1 aldehyde dehydrogenase family protein [Steroidobacteraceae bacterium]